jgi:hypothetical protein
MKMELHLNTAVPWLAALGVTAAGLALTRWIGGRTRAAWNSTLATLHGDKS